MRIISTTDVSDSHDARTIYTVALSENAFVDVMHKLEKISNKQSKQATSDMLYVMQNCDGSHVFDADGHPQADSIDESSIIAYTKHYIEQSTC